MRAWERSDEKKKLSQSTPGPHCLHEQCMCVAERLIFWGVCSRFNRLEQPYCLCEQCCSGAEHLENQDLTYFFRVSHTVFSKTRQLKWSFDNYTDIVSPFSAVLLWNLARCDLLQKNKSVNISRSWREECVELEKRKRSYTLATLPVWAAHACRGMSSVFVWFFCAWLEQPHCPCEQRCSGVTHRVWGPTYFLQVTHTVFSKNRQLKCLTQNFLCPFQNKSPLTTFQ